MRSKKWTLKTLFIRISKILGWTALSLLLLLIALIAAIQLPAVQKKIIAKAVAIAEKELGTKVSVKQISISFPKRLVVKDLYIQDLAGDTLVFLHDLEIGTDLFALLHHSIQLNTVEVNGLRSHVTRRQNELSYNYSFIVNKFSDTTSVANDKSKSAWKFKVGDISLQDTRAYYDDLNAGDHADIRLGTLQITMKEFDFDKMKFVVESFRLGHANTTMIQTKNDPVTTNNASPGKSSPIDFGINTLDLEDITVAYTQQATGQRVNAKVGHGHVTSNVVSLKTNLIDLKKMIIHDSFFSFQQMAVPSAKPKPAETSTGTTTLSPWRIKLKDLDIAGTSFQLYDFNQPAVKGADPNHLWIQQLYVEARDIVFADSDYEANVESMTMTEKNGFKVRMLRGLVAVGPQKTQFQNFKFLSSASSLNFSGGATYASLSSLTRSWQKAVVDLSIHPSSLSMTDVTYFVPDLLKQIPFKIPPATTFRIAGTVRGPADNFAFDHLRIQALHNTSLAASGDVQHIMDAPNAKFNVHIDSIHTTRDDILSVLPDSLHPRSVRIPRWLTLEGNVKGRLRAPSLNLELRTSDGSIDLNGYADMDSANVGSYRADISVHHLALGGIIKNDSIGQISLVAHVMGYGVTRKNMDASVSMTISTLQYARYNYENISIDGSVVHDLFIGNASIKNKNLDFEINATLDYSKGVPNYKLTARLIDADLNALHLTFRPIKARGTLAINLSTSDLKVLNGTMAVRNVAIFNGQQLYSVDSLLFASIDTKGQTSIRINSDIIDGSFTGTIHLLSLPDVLERHFNSYFSLKDSAHSAAVDNQDFKFQLNLKNTDLITGVLFPSLRSFEPSPVTGNFNSATRQLDIHAEVQKVRYEGLNIQDFAVNINSNSKALDLSFSLNDFRYDSLKVPGMTLTSRVAHDSIKTTLTVLDSLQKQKYLLGTVLNSLKNDFQFRFIPGKVFLNYNEWKVPDDNYIRFHHESLTAHNFSIEHQQEKISVETRQDQDATVTLGFQHFDLENIFNIVSGQSSIVAGNLDGDLNVFIKKNNAFNAALKINDLTIMNRMWGTLALAADRVGDDKFDVTMTVKGEHSDLSLKGSYVTTKPASLIHLTAEINNVDMQLLEPLSFGQVKKANGAVHGQLDITGTVAMPVIKGDINFKDVNFVSSYVNSAFTLKNETISFTGSGVTIKDFKMLDDNNNVATLKGSIQTANYRKYTLDLDLTTKNFKVLNTTVKNNGLYYGKVKMNATAKVTGPLDLPLVNLKMAFSDDTEFTYVIPVTSKGVTAQKGIVVFVDKHPPKDPFLASLHLEDTVQNFIRGFDLTANVTLKDAQKFNIIIDPKSGDKLSVQGSTTLIIKIDPSGNMDLSGQYEISKGSYSFSFYKLVRRDFEISKGGTITWAGDPFDATFDLQAVYKLETSPLELLSTQVSATDLNPYRQAFPFLVYLNIKGQISAPEISFKIDMPEASKSVLGGNVYAAIQDINTREPDLNKQVFSLLVLRRFMADDPFENQVTTSLSSNAKSSVSGILTEQLNRLSQNIKGIQLTVNLKSFDDYTTGTPVNQTQLQLGVQKTLLHNKLVVKLAGNVDIAGENTNQSSLTDYIGDLALEYKVNPDGTLRLTGFRNSDYDMIDGELIKTGAGVIFVKDFDTFKELFKATPKDQ